MDIPTDFEFMKPEVKLISVTPDAEKHMAYCARVSNPANQDNEKFSGLLKYCIQHQHWSIFEQASMTVEINTTRGIAAQILRHRSFTYQEFLKRVEFFEEVPLMVGLREQVIKNEAPVLVSVLYNKEEDTFSVVQFNKEVGCFLSSGKSLKFNMQGLKEKDMK